MPQLHSIGVRASMVLVVVALAGTAAPAAAATLQGRVLDPQHEALAGARVVLEQDGTALRREASTDASGAFTLPELPPGTYTLVDRGPGLRDPDPHGPGPRRRPALPARRDTRGGRARGDDRRVGVSGAPDLRLLDRGRRHRPDRHRPASLERPQLHGAGLSRSRQRAHSQLRPHQDQQRGRVLRRPVRARRHGHDRRAGEQRRRGGRSAAERAPGRGAGVPDRDQSRTPRRAAAPRRPRSTS